MAYSRAWKCAVAACLPFVLAACSGDDGSAANATDASTGAAGTVSGGPADTGPTSTTAGGTANDSLDTTDPPPTTDGEAGCCTPHAAASCNPFSVAQCVCEQRPFCCEFEWDAACVDVATNSCQGCGPVDDTGTTGTVGDGDCCQANGTPGCDDPTIQACTCAAQASCCDAWDDTCVQVADSQCGASCGMGSGSDTGGTTAGGSGTASGSGSGTATSTGTAG